MHPYTAAGHLYEAGFRYGKGLVIGLAVVWAESRFTETAKNYNYHWRDPKTGETSPSFHEGWEAYVDSIDRGFWQINDKAHPDVTDACAFDAGCSTQVAFDLSHNGKDFTSWAAYGDGKPGKPYRDWLEQARYLTAAFYACDLGLHDMARRILDAP